MYFKQAFQIYKTLIRWIVNHGVPCGFGARNMFTTFMVSSFNIWCLKSPVPCGSGMQTHVLDYKERIQC
jgi:hypothetical protein